MSTNWTVKAAKPIFFLALFLAGLCTQAQKIVDRTVDIQATNIELSEALDLIATTADFRLSYNSDIINETEKVDLFASNSTVKELLDQLLGEGMTYKQSGEHLIILGPKSGKDRSRISGRVIDLRDERPIEGVLVLEIDEVNAARTDGQGRFELKISGKRSSTGLLLVRAGYRDSIIFFEPGSEKLDFHLEPEFELEKVDVRRTDTLRQVDDLALTRLLVSKEQQAQARELNFLEERKIQFSVIPGVSTNKSVSGIVTNEISVNLFAGYQGALNGFEIGGIANLLRKDMNGFQGAGIANLVGGNSKGVQMAGFLNNTLGSFNGAQLSGFANVVWDTLTGAQVTGGVNVLRGGMKGVQVSGLANVTTEDCDGAQVSGGANVTVGDVSSFQASGLFNYGRNVTGSQFTLGFNVTPGDVAGGQLGILGNYAKTVEGGQVGLINIVSKETAGGQVGLINYSTRSEGGQVGLLNFSDSIGGVSVGLLSFAWRGYHRLDLYATELMLWNISFRTGTSQFYNAFTFGASSINTGQGSGRVNVSGRNWMFGYGFGGEINWPNRHTVNIEVTGNHLNEGDQWIDALNLVAKLDVTYNYTMPKMFTVFIGPSFNMLISNWQDPETGEYLSNVPVNYAFEQVNEDVLLRGWFGARLGVGVRF